MASNIKIKRSETSGNPAVLGAGEFAYSALPNSGTNGGDRLYLGSGTETSGNAVNHVVVGGKYFTDMLDHTPGTLTASSALITDSSNKINNIKVGNIDIVTNTISSTNVNGNIVLAPNGTGKISMYNAYNLPTNVGTATYVLTTDGLGNTSWEASAGAAYASAVITFLNTPTTANLRTAVTGTTGTDNLVFGTSPTISTSIITDSATFSAFNTTATTLNIGGAATSLNLGAATGTTTVNNDLAAKSFTTSGHILPTTDVAYDLGSSTKRFRSLYLSGSTIDLGGTLLKGGVDGIQLAALNDTPVGNVTPSTGTFTSLSSSGNLVVGGNLTVNGTVTTINSTTITIDDKNIELASVASPSDITADGAGLTVKGTTDKTFNWVNATSSWTSSENLEVASGKALRINGNSVLNATTLGTGVVNSSLTTLGTIATGVWNATVISVTYGGTGLATATSRGALYGNGTSAFGITAASDTDGSFLREDATGNPYWSNAIDGGIY
jgi:hypothetical protein